MKRLTIGMLAVAMAIGAARVSAQTTTPGEVAKRLGFSDAEIEQIKKGEIISKDLAEGSDKELAGVVAVFFARPVKELVEVAMQGKLLETDPTITALHSWGPDDPADAAFAKLGLDASETDEAGLFAAAEPGGKLNLSTAELASFKAIKADPAAVNGPLRAMLKARYAAYRQTGLKGVAPYARGGRKESTPGTELTLAIKETMPAAPAQADYFQALLDYPAKPAEKVEHRFYCLKQTVEKRPTFILSHRTGRQGANGALLTELQYYVGHSYNSNFIAGGCLAVEGGTLVFYVNRTFTDQVAGFGSGLKHNIGRGQMLSAVIDNLRRVREQFPK